MLSNSTQGLSQSHVRAERGLWVPAHVPDSSFHCFECTCRNFRGGRRRQSALACAALKQNIIQGVEVGSTKVEIGKFASSGVEPESLPPRKCLRKGDPRRSE